MSVYRTIGPLVEEIPLTNKIAPAGTPRFAASYLGLFCLPLSNNEDASLYVLTLIPHIFRR